MPELIWNGKYDDNGQIAAPPRTALPFQTVETVNQSAQERQMALAAASAGANPQWRNRLIWGDKKYVLPSLLNEFAGKIDLIYIDPPFATGADFSFRAQIHPPADSEVENNRRQGITLDYTPNLIEEIAYRDTWGGGLDTYLTWMFETLTLLRDLLAETGSIYVHCDWRTSHYIKAQMDNIFGYDNFRNEIVWSYGGRGAKAISGQFPRNHDVVYLYTRTQNSTYNFVYEPIQYNINALPSYISIDDDGKAFKTSPRGDYTDESIARLRAEGRIYESRTGNIRIKYFLERSGKFVYEPKLVGDVWDSIPDMMHSPVKERLNYPTQKPEVLLERIINASSNPGDLVLDCFVGSGTTAAVAERLGRRWIAADMGRFAISTTRKRLLSLVNVKPFYVQNLGRYERQAWQIGEFGDAAQQQAYREFILDLYKALPVQGYRWLHGQRAGRMVHVGAVDAPVTLDDAQAAVDEFRSVMGSGADAPTTAGVDILGWDFGMEVDTEAQAVAEAAGIALRLRRIPREVMDQKAVDAGDVRFFELASLSVKQSVNRRQRSVELTLDDFIMPLDGVPDDVRQKVTHWSQWIDYWAVDWDYQNDTFNNQWQSYRTRQDPKLQLSASHSYEERGERTIVVKVIDILGNDTTRRLEVKA